MCGWITKLWFDCNFIKLMQTEYSNLFSFQNFITAVTSLCVYIFCSHGNTWIVQEDSC